MSAMASGPSVSGTVRGRVETFDDPEGYGTVTSSDPEGTWFFHCTAIADGTRTIAPDTAVKFKLRPGPLGALEATAIKPAG